MKKNRYTIRRIGLATTMFALSAVIAATVRRRLQASTTSPNYYR